MGELLGYARVSTVDQNADLQRDALTSAGCYRVFLDHASGALDERPELAKVWDQLRPGDTLVVWRLDRLGRSLRHLIDTLTTLEERGVGFRSLQESIDTTTPGGRLVFHVFGALAEFERELIRERTKAGLAAARARGRKGGRPSLLTPDKLRAARRMYEQKDMTVAQIGQVLGVSRTTVYRALGGEQGIPSPAAAKRRPRKQVTATPATRVAPATPPKEPVPPAKTSSAAGETVSGASADRAEQPATPARGVTPVPKSGPPRARRPATRPGGSSLLDRAPAYRGAADPAKWEVRTQRGDSDILRVVVDGTDVGSVQRLAPGKYSSRWEGNPVGEPHYKRQQDAVTQVLLAEQDARRRYYAARSRRRRTGEHNGQ